MMEAVASILAATAVVFVLLIIAANIYCYIRPKFRIHVKCWFCHEGTYVTYDKRASWDCPFCEQYNGFSSDGGYNKVIPAQHDASLNKPVATRRGTKEKQPPVNGNGLCPQCNTNQQLKIHQLASFSASDPSRYDYEVEKFGRKLEHYYRLCTACEATLERTLTTQASWLQRLRLDRLRTAALLQKDTMARRFGSLRPAGVQFLRCLTATLASWLLVCVAAYLIDPHFTQIPLSTVIHAVLHSTFPGLPNSLLIPSAFGGLLRATLEWEVYLTAGGGAVQLLAEVSQAKMFGRSRWLVVNILSVLLWAILHGLSWVTMWGEVNTWVSPRSLKIIHAGSVLGTLVTCLIVTFKSSFTIGKRAKKLPSMPASDQLDFSDNGEMKATSATIKRKDDNDEKDDTYIPEQLSPKPCVTASGFPTGSEFRTANMHDASNFKNANINHADNFNTSPHLKFDLTNSNNGVESYDTASPLNSHPAHSVNNLNSCFDSFKTFRTSCSRNSMLDERNFRDPYKTRSRLVKPMFSPVRRSPNDISELLNCSVGNVSLPVKTSTPEKDTDSFQVPRDIDDGLSNLKLGSLLNGDESRQRVGSEDGYMELFKGSNNPPTCQRRSVLSPSRFRPQTNVARSSWVAGGFWQSPRVPYTPTDLHPPFSQTSSQSSGFASQSSQMPNSRSSSVCGGDFDTHSVTSEGCGSGFCHRVPTPEDKTPRPSLVYNMTGGFSYPRSMSSEAGIDSTFSASKNLVFPESEHQAYFYHGDRMFGYPPPLFSPQPYYFQQTLPPVYGTRYCYQQQIPPPSLWNQNAFASPQQQLCITNQGDVSRSSSRCSDTNDTFEVKPVTGHHLDGHFRFSIANVLVIVALVCSLFYNALYSGVLSVPKQG